MVQSWVGLSGRLKLERSGIICLEKLSSWCLGPKVWWIQAGEVVLNIGHCLGDGLDKKGWQVLLGAL